MILRSIELKDVRSIKNQKLFLDGFKILLGKNGSGKSTFLYAIPFCFFGHIDWKLSDMLRWGAKEGKVAIEFENKDTMYKAVREFTKTSSSFSLYQQINGSYKDIGGGLNSQAQETLQKILPINKEIMLSLITKIQTDDPKYSLGSFCNATSKGMYDIIKEFLEVEALQKYEEYNNNLIKDFNIDLNKLEGKIEVSKEIIDSFEYLDPKPLEEEERVMNKKIKQIDDLLEKCKQYDKQFVSYTSAQEFIQKHNAIEELIIEWNKVKGATEPEVAYDPDEYESIEKEIECIKKKNKQTKQQLENIEVGEDEDLVDIKVELSELEKALNLYKQGKCHTCSRRFNNTEERTKETKSEISSLKEKLEIMDNKNKENRKSRKLMEDLKNRIGLLGTNESNLSLKLAKMESSKSETKKWKDYNNFRLSYPFKKNPDEIYRKYLNANDVEEPSKPQGYRPASNLTARKKELKSNLKILMNRIQKIKHDNENLEHHLSLVKKNRSKFKELENKIELHKQLSRVYSRKGAQHFMTKTFLNALEYHSNKYLRRFTSNRFSIKFETSTEGRDNIKMVLFDAERGNKPRPYSTLSRGEKTRVSLSIELLGMRKTFSDFRGVYIGSCFLDEVYGLDEEGQKEYASILEEMSSEVPVIVGVVCFESMANNFESIQRVEDGKLI